MNTIEIWDIKWDNRGVERGFLNRMLLGIELFVDTDDENELKEQISQYLKDEFDCSHNGFRWKKSHKELIY